MERVKSTTLKRRVSWGSIIGGVITVLGISILLAILTSSIGLFMFDPQSENPGSGIGTAVGIITVISLLISLCAGGFVAGKLAGADGIIHGFLVWATTLLVTVIMLVSLAAGAVRMTGNILGSVSSMAGNVLSGAGSVVEGGFSMLSDDADGIFGNIDFTGEYNQNEIRQDVRQALRRSGVKEFQPEYLERQSRAVKNDLDKTVRRIIANPMNAEAIINGFADRLKNRMDNFAQNVNREDIERAISNNTNLTRAEAEETVDQYIYMYDQAREQLANLDQSIEQAKQEWQVMKQNALEAADKATNAAGRSALISFFALLIGAGICAVAGHYGTRTTKEGYEV